MKTTLTFFKQFFTLLFFPSLFSFSLLAQSEVKMYQENWTIPGYITPLPDPNPMFFKNESYQGASKFTYPYMLMNNIISEKEEKTLHTVILENEFIKLCITPEIGGKLYYATDKTNGYNFIYKNNSYKPADIGMFGAWVSGGIEWCLIHHHRPSTFMPIDYTMVENKDGSKTVWVGEIEQRSRMRWTVGLTVFPGKSYFQTEVKIHNRSAVTQSFLYWANVATHVNNDYQVLFPPSTDVAVFHAKNQFSHWPISKEVYNNVDYTSGVDVSKWKNHPKPTSMFAYDLKEDFSGGYDFGKQSGTVHVADHNVVKGAKVWLWGNGKEGQIWDKALSDTDGSYAELMVGAFSDNQPDYSWIKPYEVKSFKQYWYPIKNTDGFKNANLNGAVNLDYKGDKVLISYYSTSKLANSKVVLLNKGTVVFEKNVELSPEKTFSEVIKLPKGTAETDLKTFLFDITKGDTLISYQPKSKSYKEELPAIVEVPELPNKIQTVEELFLTGSRIQQFHNATLNALDYYNEALKRDSNDIRTNIAMGKTYLKKADYVHAKEYLRTAIKRLTKNYTRPESCEALYLLGLALKETGEYESAIDTLNRAAWDYTFTAAAYTELAKINYLKRNYTTALENINRSLASYQLNNTALCIKANVLLKLGENQEAIALLESLTKQDPLDFFALYSKYIASNKNESILQEFKLKMRQFDQDYLELACDFMNIGEWENSNVLLSIYLQEVKDNWVNPIAYYYLGFCNYQLNNVELSKNYFKMATNLPVDFCFPFRFETIKVLQTALQYNPADSKAYYYLGNILFDHQPKLAINYWEKAVQIDPTLALAYRNLGWGYYHTEKNMVKAISAYEKALSVKSDDPIYYSELDVLYELNNSDIQKRVQLFKGKQDIVNRRADSYQRGCRVLNLIGEYKQTIDYLSQCKFQLIEGKNPIRDAKVDASILLGKQYLATSQYAEALKLFKNAHYLPGKDAEMKEYEDERMPQIDYFMGLVYKSMGDKKKSDFYFNRSAAYSLNVKEGNYVKYYQAMSFLNLGKKDKANAIFDELIKYGDSVLNKGLEVDFFAKWGGADTENMAKSSAYLLKGLGLKGLNKTAEYKECLKKSIELNASNLWAKAEL